MTRRRFALLLSLLPLLARGAQAAAWEPTIAELGPTAVEEMVRIKAELAKMGEAAVEGEVERGRAWLAGRAVVEPPAGSWHDLPGGARVRVLKPSKGTGLYLFVHGGGWCMGSALAGEERLWKLAQELNVVVVSVDYRLAPEHPYPAAVEDCREAADWVARHFPDLPRALGGASAGAHLAALTLLARPQLFRGAVLWYGAYDLSRPYPGKDSQHPDLGPQLLTRCRRRFLGKADGAAASPLFARLEGLPPALFLVGDSDILYEDSVKLATAYAAANSGKSELVVYRQAIHGFDGYNCLAAADAQRRAGEFLRRVLG